MSGDNHGHGDHDEFLHKVEEMVGKKKRLLDTTKLEHTRAYSQAAQYGVGQSIRLKRLASALA